MYAIDLDTQSALNSAGPSFIPMPEGRQTFTVVGSKKLSDGSTKLTLVSQNGETGHYTVWSAARGKTPESGQAMLRFTYSLLLGVFGRLDFKIGDTGTGVFEHRIDDQNRIWSNLVAV